MKNFTNTRNCLIIVLIMEAIKEAPEKICYDDIHNFLARHPEYKRICEVSIEMDDPMTSAEKKVYTRLLSSRCFRRDALLFLGYLEHRYRNQEERVIDPAVHFTKHFSHLYDTTLNVSDVEPLTTLLRNPNGRMDTPFIGQK